MKRVQRKEEIQKKEEPNHTITIDPNLVTEVPRLRELVDAALPEASYSELVENAIKVVVSAIANQIPWDQIKVKSRLICV